MKFLIPGGLFDVCPLLTQVVAHPARGARCRGNCGA